MAIVASGALSTMISNEIVMPALLRIKAVALSGRTDYSRLLIHIRRGSIVGILLLAQPGQFSTNCPGYPTLPKMGR